LGIDQNTSNDNKITVQNASKSAVFSLNQIWDILASGAATIAKLNLNPIIPAEAVSQTEVIATSSAGTATIKAYHQEITIDNPLVTENSLIYITPAGPTNGQNPYLVRQVQGISFTVGISKIVDRDSPFNYLIIN
jgi:hypothetical protein